MILLLAFEDPPPLPCDWTATSAVCAGGSPPHSAVAPLSQSQPRRLGEGWLRLPGDRGADILQVLTAHGCPCWRPSAGNEHVLEASPLPGT